MAAPNKPTSYIESIALETCSKQMSRVGPSGVELDACVDGYWHRAAARLEAGHIDEAGNKLTAFDLEKSIEAYRDWYSRHPQSKAR